MEKFSFQRALSLSPLWRLNETPILDLKPYIHSFTSSRILFAVEGIIFFIQQLTEFNKERGRERARGKINQLSFFPSSMLPIRSHEAVRPKIPWVIENERFLAAFHHLHSHSKQHEADHISAFTPYNVVWQAVIVAIFAAHFETVWLFLLLNEKSRDEWKFMLS